MLIQASARFLDTQFLDPTVAAVAAQNPASVTAGVTPVAPGATNDATVAALVSAFFAARPNATLPCFVCSPAVAAAIAGSGNHPGLLTTGGTLVGIPVVTTIGAAGNLILLDGPGVYAFDGGAEIDTSRHAAFETEAAPTDPPTAATVLVDLWSHDLIGIRLDRFCSWAAEPNAVSYAVVA
jgi:hypothetical protein